eukprot:gene5796-7209_t
MSTNQKSRVVLITGCSSGIGLALARQLHNRKDKSFIVYASARRLRSIEILEKEGLKTLQLDVTDLFSIKNAVDQIINNEGRIDVLVNNAGMAYTTPLIEANPDQSARIMDTNFFGVVNTTIEVSKHMVKQMSGLIVNVGSIVGLVSTPFTGLYCASKAALHAWSDTLRMELDPFNIHVMSVFPGSIKTEISDNSLSTTSETVENTKYYAPIKDFIMKRSRYSKNNGCTADEFAIFLSNKIANDCTVAKCAYGPGSTLFYILYYLPYWIQDFLLANKFGLGKLKKYLSQQDQPKSKDN